MKGETPIRRQYLEIKKITRTRFFFFVWAIFTKLLTKMRDLLARELDIALTSKPMGKNMRVPLAGFPYHSLERHLATLISRGHRVAICEQTSTFPVKGDDGKKLIKREVTRIVTAGTVIEPQLFDSKTNNYLVSFISDGQKSRNCLCRCYDGRFCRHGNK